MKLFDVFDKTGNKIGEIHEGKVDLMTLDVFLVR